MLTGALQGQYEPDFAGVEALEGARLRGFEAATHRSPVRQVIQRRRTTRNNPQGRSR